MHACVCCKFHTTGLGFDINLTLRRLRITIFLFDMMNNKIFQRKRIKNYSCMFEKANAIRTMRIRMVTKTTSTFVERVATKRSGWGDHTHPKRFLAPGGYYCIFVTTQCITVARRASTLENQEIRRFIEFSTKYAALY